jgi:hypothetical protein
MRWISLICLLLAPLISGFGFFGGGGGSPFGFEFEDNGSDDGGKTNGRDTSKPFICQFSKLYNLNDVCVDHPQNCPCPPGENKCILGDGYICVEESFPCPKKTI